MELELIDRAEKILYRYIYGYDSIISESVGTADLKRIVIYIYLDVFGEAHSEGIYLFALRNVFKEKYNIIYDSEDEFLLDVISINNVKQSLVTKNEDTESENILLSDLGDDKIETSGYIYIAINSSMPGMVKIGMTKREPEIRMSELSSATGVPTPYTLIYKEYFHDCMKAETLVHELLENKNTRVSNNREFFSIPVHDAIKLIQDVKYNLDDKTDFKKVSEREIIEFDNSEMIQELMEKGEDYLGGYGLELQNFPKGFSYLEKAVKLGSAEACWKIGKAYTNTFYEDDGLTMSVSKALEYFEKGMKLDGKIFSNKCTAEIALILSGQCQFIDNKYSFKYNAKSFWKEYFENLTLENSDGDAYYLADYITLYLYEIDKYQQKDDFYEESLYKMNWFKYEIYDQAQFKLSLIINVKNVTLERKKQAIFIKDFIKRNFVMNSSITGIHDDSSNKYMKTIIRFNKIIDKNIFELELKSSFKFEKENVLHIFGKSDYYMFGVIFSLLSEESVDDHGFQIYTSIVQFESHKPLPENVSNRIKLEHKYESEIIITGDYKKTENPSNITEEIKNTTIVTNRKGFFSKLFAK